jgi:tetratricopeptide (TPR) repeat protein
MSRDRLIRLAALALIAGTLTAGLAPAARGDVSAAPEDVAKLYRAGHYDQAVEALQAAVSRDPRDASLDYWLGRSFYELSDFARAMASLERAVTIEPGNSEYHHWLGRACGRRAEESNPFSALTLARRTHHEFETAVRLDPSNLAAQRDFIRYLLFAPGIVGGGEDHALEQMAALALVDSVEADLARAEYFTSRKRFDQAGEQYQKILQARPASAGVYLEIAEYYRDRGEAGHMQEVVDGAAKVAPSDQRLEYYRGVALILAMRDASQAEKHLRTYLATVPPSSEAVSHASARQWLGKLYEHEGRLDQAAAEYEAAIMLDPRNKVLHEDLKRVQHK